MVVPQHKIDVAASVPSTPAADLGAVGAARVIAPGPVHALLMDDGRIDRTLLERAVDGAQNEIRTIDCASLGEAKALWESGQADLIVMDSGQEGEALALMRQIAEDPQLGSVPVVYLGNTMVVEEVIAAMRAGVSDCIQASALTPEALDQAIEAAMGRARGTVSDQRAQISNLMAENEALRRIAARNMRLLKSETMPLLSLAWRFAEGERLPAEERTRTAKGLARITRNVAGLIDDTVIVAATHKANATDEPIVLSEVLETVLRDDLGEISASRAHIVARDLPVLRGRRAHFQMLFEELLLTAVRNGRMGRVPEIEIHGARDPEGNPIIVFTERGIQLSARKQGLAQRGSDLAPRPEEAGPDPHAWSLCQRLVEKNGGRFRISKGEGDSTRLMMRFPATALVTAPSHA